MGISHDIISEFVKITNDKKEKPKEETVYATIVQASDGKYVKIDGSDLITPTETTTDIEEGERVTVLIKDHSAIITGNITSPSASANRVNGIVDVVNEKLGVFETIVADKIDVNELNAYKATIEHLIVGKAEIEDLEAARAKIGFLDADVAHIKTLVAGNLTSDNILSFNITADKVTMADAFIKDAMVDTINAAKINAGRLNTNNVIIGSDDGGMLISGATQQFTDKDGKVRIQIGRDSTGDFTFVLYGEDGTGQIINQNGITASAVSDGLIVNDMINNNAAISGGKLDISSVIFEINNENDTAIHSSKIYLDEQNQSLEAAFNSLKTQVDTIVDISIDGDLKAFTEQIQSNTAKIEMNKSSINTLVSEDAVIRKEVSDLEGNLIETTNTLSSKYASLEQSMDGFKFEVADVYATKSTVKDLENNVTTNYATTSAMNSAIQQKADEITSTVSMTKLAGGELLPQGYRNGDSTSGYYSISGGILKCDEWGLYTTERTYVVSDYIAVDPSLPITYEYEITNADGTPYTYLGVEQFTRNKEGVDDSKLINFVYTAFRGTKKGSGTLTLNSDTRYIRLRWMSDWSNDGMSYCQLNNISLKQLGSINSSTQIAQKTDEINLSVSNIRHGLTNANLLVGSFDYTPDTYWYQPSDTAISSSQTLYDCKAWRTDVDWGGMKVNLKYLLNRGVFEVGKPYTFSIYGRTSSGTCKLGAYMHHFYKGDFTVTTQWKQFSFTFTPTQSWIDEITDTNTMRFEPYELSDTGNRFYGACYKLERGTIATPWTTNSSDVSLIKQQADSITSTVSTYRTGVANLLVNSSEGKQLNNPSSGYHDIHYYLCGDLNNIYFHEARYFCLSFTVGYTGSFINAPFHSISFQNNWATRWYAGDIQKIERVGDNAYRYYMKPLRCASTFITADKLTFIAENGDGNGWFYNVMLTEGELHPSAYTPSNHDYSNKFSEIKQTTDSITSTVNNNYTALNNKFSEIKQTADGITSTVNNNYTTLNNKFSNYPTITQMNSSITQLSNQIATKVDVNGVKSTIQQNPESVRIGFNAISNYFDLNSTRLQVGHSDGSYTQIGQDGIVYYDAHANWRYHSLIKQGWLGDISGTSWSRTITLPPSFKGKVFSVIVSIEMVNAVNTHDVIKHFKVTVPHDTVNYANGTFVINMNALAYYVPGQQSATAITTNVSWIAIA